LARKHYSLIVDDSEEIDETSSSATDPDIVKFVREQRR